MKWTQCWPISAWKYGQFLSTGAAGAFLSVGYSHRLNVRMERTTYYRFGRLIREFRETRQWTQADLAAASEISRHRIGRIERAQVLGAEHALVQRIARALGLSDEGVRCLLIAACHDLCIRDAFRYLRESHQRELIHSAVDAALRSGKAVCAAQARALRSVVGSHRRAGLYEHTGEVDMT